MINLYQQPSNQNMYFVLANNPVYYTVTDDRALEITNFHYRFDLYKNQQTGTSPILVNSSKIYPSINGGLGYYNPISLLKSEITEYFHPDEFGFHYPTNILNYRVDVTPVGSGLTSDTILSYTDGEFYGVVGNGGFVLTIGDWYEIIEGNGANFVIVGADDNEIGTVFQATGQNPVWGQDGILLNKVPVYDTIIYPTSYDKNILIGGYEEMSPDYLQLDGCDSRLYVMNNNLNNLGTKGKMLSRQNFRNKLTLNERCTLRAIQGKLDLTSNSYTSILNNIMITVTHPDGSGNKYKYRYDNVQNTWANNERYLSGNTFLQNLTGMLTEIPIGPWNITYAGEIFSQVASKTPTGSWHSDIIEIVNGGDILSVGDIYTVDSYKDLSPSYSDSYEFEVVCPQYTPYQLAWENQLGGYDYYSFSMQSTSNEKTEKEFFEIKMDKIGQNIHTNSDYYYGKNQQSKGNQIFTTKSNITIELNSDWLSNKELEFFRDLLKSKNVYLLDETVYSKYTNLQGNNSESLGRWYSVMLDADSIEFKTNKKGLKQLAINVIKNTTKS